MLGLATPLEVPGKALGKAGKGRWVSPRLSRCRERRGERTMGLATPLEVPGPCNVSYVMYALYVMYVMYILYVVYVM